MNLSIVILAAGFGTRMKSEIPKPLHKICQHEMIDYILKIARNLSDDITLIVHNQAEKIIAHCGENFSYIQQDMQLHKGTGGALINYSPKNENVLILNADMPLISEETLRKIAQNPSDICLSTFLKNEANSYGRVIKNDGKITKIVETKDANESELACTLCNAGVYKIKKSVLSRFIPLLSNDNAQNEYYLTDIIKMAIDAGLKVDEICGSENEFFGINSKLDLEKAEQIMQEKIKNDLLTSGVTMQNKASIFIDPLAKISPTCVLESGVQIIGECLLVNAHIKAHSVIEESIISNSSIGPLAHIRPKCTIKNSKIGNFVECKAAQLDGVKAGHLAYLGDCLIQSGVNISCGVIICNYDGKNKHKTIIEKDAFIGSNANIIAPCVIPQNSMIAAGSSIGQKDAAKLGDKDLFIERSAGKIIKNFKGF